MHNVFDIPELLILYESSDKKAPQHCFKETHSTNNRFWLELTGINQLTTRVFLEILRDVESEMFKV